MKTSIVDNKLVVEIETVDPTPSTSGKTLVVASTHGNVTTDVIIDGKPLVIGVNAYIASNGDRPYTKNEDKSTKLSGKNLIVTLPLQDATPSSSGKTLVVASTHGNIVTNAKISNKNVVLGVNAYYSK